MTSIKLKSHVGSDGILKLEVPVGISNTDLEVVLVVEPIAYKTTRTPEELGWPPDFLVKVAGGWQGEPLVHAPQGEYEVREELE